MTQQTQSRSNSENIGYTDYDVAIATMADEGAGSALIKRGRDSRDFYPARQAMMADEDGMGAAIR